MIAQINPTDYLVIFRDFGFPTAMVIVFGYTIYKLFAWATKRHEKLESRIDTLTKQSYEEREKFLESLRANTRAVQEVGSAMQVLERRMEHIESNIGELRMDHTAIMQSNEAKKNLSR